MIRPAPASWFEIITAREDALPLVKALARAGCAEFEPLAGGVPEADTTALRQRFRELERRYSAVWAETAAAAATVALPPAGAPAPSSAATASPLPYILQAPTPAEPAALLAQAVAVVERWAAVADPVLATLAAGQRELRELDRWQLLLAAPALSPAVQAALAGAPRVVAAAVFAVDESAAGEAPPGLLLTPLEVAGTGYLLALGPPEALHGFGEQVAARGGRRLDAPAWLAGTDPQATLAHRRSRCQEQVATCRAGLATLARDSGLQRAVSDAAQACWCLENVPSAQVRQALCGLSGWTADRGALARTVDASGARALIRYAPPPPGLQSPLLLHNPWWVSPYEVFSRLLGMPERNAPDPSVVIALAFPLLFGYMFGDVGQGLLLAAGGLALGRRWPLARLFIPGGAVAAACGLLFGSVFSLQGVLPALWVEPLDDPLRVLLVPLFGGALLLLTGLALSAIAAHWRKELGNWVVSDGAATATYVGLLASFADPAGLLFAALAALAAALWAGIAARRASAFLIALAGTLEKTLQLAINTLSFVRVGAFAIAHAGLSAALGLLAAAAGDGATLVVIAGNLFIIALEVLVVSVQTTRLLLFEFFIRFFAGSGRAFQPAPLPPSDASDALENRHER